MTWRARTTDIQIFLEFARDFKTLLRRFSKLMLFFGQRVLNGLDGVVQFLRGLSQPRGIAQGCWVWAAILGYALADIVYFVSKANDLKDITSKAESAYAIHGGDVSTL